jgi:hypothetical protein
LNVDLRSNLTSAAPHTADSRRPDIDTSDLKVEAFQYSNVKDVDPKRYRIIQQKLYDEAGLFSLALRRIHQVEMIYRFNIGFLFSSKHEIN